MFAIAAVALICSGPGDYEWTVKDRTISTQLRAEKSVGILKDEQELNRGKRWRVQFPGGQAFLTITDDRRYTLLWAEGDATHGTCVSR